MIKGVILDVDGVIVGDKKGYNWPQPNSVVITALKNLRKNGIIISLCSGKGTFALKNIVETAHLNNLHIGDGGAIVIDFLDNVTIEKHMLEKQLALKVMKVYLEHDVYLEIYTADDYYIQKNKVSYLTQIHSDILYRKPIIVESLIEAAQNLEIVKIMPVAKNDSEKKEIIAIFHQFKNQLSLQWGTHPTMNPATVAIITKPGISKKHAAITISRYTKIPLEEMLGVGDGMTDWNFMQLCRYVGVMGNASEDLKKIAQTKKENCFIGPSVNENGLLAIFKHFGLSNMVY